MKDFDLKEEFFETVYHPADLVMDIAYYTEGETCATSVRTDAIVGTTHPSYYGLNWLQMLISLERHKDDYDVEKVKEAILNTESFEHIHLSKFGIFYFIDGGGNHCVYPR